MEKKLTKVWLRGAKSRATMDLLGRRPFSLHRRRLVLPEDIYNIVYYIS